MNNGWRSRNHYAAAACLETESKILLGENGQNDFWWHREKEK